MDTKEIKQIVASIKKARVDSGLSISAAAEIAKMNKTNWGEIERGIRRPSVTLLRRMAEAVGGQIDLICEIPVGGARVVV